MEKENHLIKSLINLVTMKHHIVYVNVYIPKASSLINSIPLSMHYIAME